MLQHLLLMMIAPPLLWLGAPLFPLLLGLPRSIRTHWVAPLFRSRILRRAFRWLTHPVPAWLLFAAATWIWHLPPTYELALASDGWHYLQHICFLVTALIFWYPVIRPFPSRPRWSPWLLVPYLILADVQNTLLAAWLTFSDAAALCLLRQSAATRKSLAARRSGRRRSADVGARARWFT